MMSCKRPYTVKATLTSEEYETLSALAEKAGMTKAEFIRYALIHWNESFDDLAISKNKNGGRSKKLQTVSEDSNEKRSAVISSKSPMASTRRFASRRMRSARPSVRMPAA